MPKKKNKKKSSLVTHAPEELKTKVDKLSTLFTLFDTLQDEVCYVYLII